MSPSAARDKGANVEIKGAEAEMKPLLGLELETSSFDTILGLMHQPDEPKSLSDWEEVGNPLILHNNCSLSHRICFRWFEQFFPLKHIQAYIFYLCWMLHIPLLSILLIVVLS